MCLYCSVRTYYVDVQYTMHVHLPPVKVEMVQSFVHIQQHPAYLDVRVFSRPVRLLGCVVVVVVVVVFISA